MVCRVIYALGVSVKCLAEHAEPQDIVYVDNIGLEASWRSLGGRCDYIYRDCEAVFDLAAAASLNWLEKFPENLRSSDVEFSEVQKQGGIPLWTLCQDAIFEIKDGIFEGILNAFLVRDIQARNPELLVCILAPEGHSLAHAIVEWTGGEIIEVVGPAVNGIKEKPPSFMARFWNAFNVLILTPLLVRIGQLASKPNQAALAIVNSLGDMSRQFTSARGGSCLGDSYFEGLEPVLSDSYPGMLKIGLNPPHFASTRWRNQWLTWCALLRGEYRPWFFYATASDFWRQAEDCRNYSDLLVRSDADTRFRSLFQIEGLSFYLPIRKRMQSLLPSTLASLRLHYVIAQRLVAQERIRLVISAEAFSNIGRCMAAALHRSGGQLFGVQAGIVTPQRVTNLGFYVPALDGHDEFIPDCFFVWGPRYAALLARYGVPAQRLAIMGFNRAKVLLSEDKRPSRKVLYVSGGNALVCPYLMTEDEEKLTLEALATELPEGAELAVRLHPRHRIGDFNWLKAQHPRVRLIIGRDQSLEDCLRDADCVVGKASTVLLEAANAGKRVLLINLAGTPEFTGFAGGPNGLPYVTNRATLRSALEQVLQNPLDNAGFTEAWSAGTATSAAQRFLGAVAFATQPYGAEAVKPSIIFLCSSGLHVRLFAPTIRYLQADGEFQPVIMSLDSFYADLHGNVASEVVTQHLSVDVEIASFTHGASQNRWWRGLQTVVSARWTGTGQYRELLRRRHASLLVLGNDTGLAELVAIDAARASKIPTLLVQDGFVTNWPPQSNAQGRRRLRIEKLKMSVLGKVFGGRPYGLGGCDAIAAYGSYWADLFSSLWGRGGPRIEVVGHPFLSFDGGGLPLTEGSGVTYFCTNFLRSNLRDKTAHNSQLAEILTIRCLLDECGEMVQPLRVRLHPADLLTDYQELNGHKGIELLKFGQLSEVIASSWLCITNLSSVVLDCAAGERLCLMSGLSVSQGTYAPLFRSLPGLKADDMQMLRDYIHILRTPSGHARLLQAQQESLTKFVSVDPGLSGARRLTHFVTELALGGSGSRQ